MKFTKKCENTQDKISIKDKLGTRRRNRRCSSAGMFNTSSAGAVTSLILVVAAFMFGFVGATNTYATTSTITVNIASDISLDFSPVNASGTFATSDTSTNNVSVKTNNGTGYTLGIKASVNNNNALSTTGGDTIPSHTISAGVSESNYEDDTYAETNNLNNTWGYRPSKLNSVSNSNYLPGPSSTSTVIELDKTNVANASTFNNYNLAIGARVDTATVPGEYSNVFVFTVVANPAVYSITYNKNTTDTVTNMPANVVNQQTSNETVTLDSAVPTRSGFIFKGWCTAQVADNDTCSGTTYSAGDNWAIDQTLATNSLSVYAIWGEATLYNLVASQVKTYGGSVQSPVATDLQTTITTPTSNNPATDTSNSGVFLYNESEFGASSDVDDDYDIYYFRGVLDSSFTSSTYGSGGDSAYYQNYVVLSSASAKANLATTDTCWRIVRTTASGGTKMIYNGKWTGSTCANVQDNANAKGSTGIAFNGTSYTNQQIVRVGYTYNETYAVNTASTATIGEVLGTNSTASVNNLDSTIKDYIEDTFFPNISSYESILETSAGYCNDRSAYDNTAPYTLQPENTNIRTYGNSGLEYLNFGASIRNFKTLADNNNRKLTLNCARNVVDLYSVNGASTGNGQMSEPAALLTADEAAFAGSGSSSATQGSAYNDSSFLRSGSLFWLLSPSYRSTNSYMGEFDLYSDGRLYNTGVDSALGVRPAISIISETTATNGTGTATDPWIVNPDPAPAKLWFQDATSANCGETMYDNRGSDAYKEIEYTTATINGLCWMTRNLDLPGGTTITKSDSNITADSYTLPASSTSGFIDDSTAYVYNSGRTTPCSSPGCYSYYSYAAATAGTNPSSGAAGSDICPYGWRLPTSAELTSLKNTYTTGATLTASPFYGVYAGRYYNSSFNYGDTDGYYWSSTANGSSNAYHLYFNSSSANVYDNGRKRSGYSIRCVMKNS